MAICSVYDIQVHYLGKINKIPNIDPNKYCYFDLLSDVCEVALNSLPRNLNVTIALNYEVPDTNARMEVDGDMQVLEMFRLHNTTGVINLHVDVMNGDGNINAGHHDLNVNGDGNINAGLDLNENRNGLNDNGATNGNQNDRNGVATSDLIMNDAFNVYVNKSTNLKHNDGVNGTMMKLNGIDDVETDDDLYVFSDNDEIPLLDDCDWMKYVINEEDSDGSDYGYQSNNDSYTLDSSDSDFEIDPLSKCLNGDEFKPADCEKFKLMKGMLFANVDDFRKVLYDYVIQEGFKPVREKNERTRVTLHCEAEGCPWRVHASPLPDGVTFQIKTCTPDHTCVMNDKIRVSAKWMAKKLVPVLRVNPEMKPAGLRDVLLKVGVIPTDMQLFRAKQKACEMIDGDHGDSYKKLPAYAHILMKTNPGSLVKIHYMKLPFCVTPSIKRIFVGIDALKKGFLNGCAPFIGFDGCHLKGPYGGVLLSAVSLDGNNGLFPIAYAVVESECRESWEFFFYWLSEFLEGFGEDKPWTFMTDRQKGLIEAVNNLVPHAVHRKCCRHIYSNFRLKFPGLQLRNLFWQATRSYNQSGFVVAMTRIKEFNSIAYQWLDNIPKDLWARHAFQGPIKNDHITNNIAESFNHWVGDLRMKPIFTLLDGLRAKVMSRLHKRYEKGCLMQGNVVPTVVAKLKKVGEASRKCTMLLASDCEFQVTDNLVNYIVNIQQRTCECKMWDITGIPCKHAAIVLINKRKKLEDYCHPTYSKDAYMKAYNEIIHPIPDPSLWHESEVQTIDVLPPPLRRKIGRPKKLRKREQGEKPPTTQSKRSSTIRCDTCKQFGHNKRTCGKGPIRDTRGKTKKNSANQEKVHNNIANNGGMQGENPANSSTLANVAHSGVKISNSNSLGTRVKKGKRKVIGQGASTLKQMFGSLRAERLLGSTAAREILACTSLSIGDTENASTTSASPNVADSSLITSVTGSASTRAITTLQLSQS